MAVTIREQVRTIDSTPGVQIAAACGCGWRGVEVLEAVAHTAETGHATYVRIKIRPIGRNGSSSGSSSSR